MKGPTRREILIAVASAGLTGTGASFFARRHSVLAPLARATTAPPAHLPFLQVLADAEYATLAAACDRIYPADDTPGAADLGVPFYVDQALAASPIPTWADGLLTGVARLDAESLQRWGLPFSASKPADQDALLSAWAAEPDGDNALFVSHLVEATLEGVLGDPIYGGNRGGGGWRAMDIRPDLFAASEVHAR